MHEAGLANAVVAAIREHGLADRPVRLLVSGGHDEPGAFDESLRFHMTLAGPELDLGRLEIVHLPTDRWCPSCGHRFAAVGDADCPACGRATLAERTEERIELEPVDDANEDATGDALPGDGPAGGSHWALPHPHDGGGPGPSDPPEGDPGPSAAPGR